MMRLTLAQLSECASSDLGTTDWIDIDQARIDQFADATNDYQWIHVDVAKASRGPFGRTIAHGYLTLSLTGASIAELLVVPDATSIVNYGLGKVRFPAPVPVGSRIRVHGRITTVAALPDAGGFQVAIVLTTERDDHDRPVCVCEAIVRFLK
jgi:acyl dehydratase